MSQSPHLNEKQFGTAQEQGKPVSDWLSTEEGHDWQDSKFDTANQSHLPSEQNYLFFSLKDYGQDESGPAEIYPDDYRSPHMRNLHISDQEEEFRNLHQYRHEQQEWANAPLQWQWQTR